MADASKKGGGMGAGGTVGHQGIGTTDPGILDEHDLANEIHGNNRLQGNDQSRTPNQRLTQPGSLDADNLPSDSPVQEARRHDGGDE